MIMTTLTMMPLMISGWEWIIIALVILLLFGGKKIPELMKGMGKGLKSFKEGMTEVEKDVKDIKEEIEKPVEKPAAKPEVKTDAEKKDGKSAE